MAVQQRTIKPIYRKLSRRLNLFPQRAPESALLYRILALLFSPREAELAAALPLRPFEASKAAAVWQMNRAQARKTLDKMARRGLLVDFFEEPGRRLYVLPPPMAGFFEFSLMRIRGDIDQKTLSELFHQYINQEDAFVRDLFLGGSTALGRVFVNEAAVGDRFCLEILAYEKASEVIATAPHIAVGMCYCRHKMEHVGKACKAPKANCMTFGQPAASLIRNNFARRVDAMEGLELLAQACEHNLVQGGENVQRQVSFICNCCACCCEGLIAARKFGLRHPIVSTNFIPRISTAHCNGCGRCVDVCPVEAVTCEARADRNGKPARLAVLNDIVCLGCGICVRNCPRKAIVLHPRAQRVITPVDTVHRLVQMAVERGVLQNLIFDNQVLLSHRMLAAFLGAVLRLPPIRRAMANAQLQSLYVDALIA